jgi:hypothetical protein
MRERNWSYYNKQLVQRGSLTFLIDPKLFKSLSAPKKRQKGRPVEFSHSLILLLMMVKIHYRLPYRMLEGFAKSVLANWYKELKLPTYSLICKRARLLKESLPKLSLRRPQTILLDASGLKVIGEGEWKVKIHGRGRPRKWIKIHLAVDSKTQEIVAHTLTSHLCSDGAMTEELLKQSGKAVKTVIADGAYDKQEVRRVIEERGCRPLIPPPKNARFKYDGGERDEALKIIKGLGGDKQARSLWGKLTGYSQRSLIETAFSRLKRCYGDRLFSQEFERQFVESYLKCYLLNQTNQIKI